MAPSLPSARLLLDLGPAVATAGFIVSDHDAVIAELSALVAAESLSERAVPKRRAEFLAGRWAARQALASLGLDAGATRGEDGTPRWPSGVVGSITHGADLALCAVARATELRGLGIDAERLMNESTKDELMSRICRDDERAALEQGLTAPEHERVTFAFSAKESLYKCLFPLTGRFMDFSAARVIEAEAARDEVGRWVGALLLELCVDWSSELLRGRVFRAPFVASAQHVESAVVLLP